MTKSTKPRIGSRLWITFPAAAAMFALAGCLPQDETLTRYGAAGQTWILQELNGAAFAAKATLVFGRGGAVSGDGPCNSYRGQNSSPYPWFDVQELAATRKVCPDLLAETQFLDTLRTMTESEVSGSVLILRNGSDSEMVFKGDG